MRSLIYSFLAVVALFGATGANAQIEEINGGPVNVPTEGIIDGVFIQEHIPTKRMIPYEFVREADAIWSRRVFEYIDLREKINHQMYYPLDEITNQGVWVRNASRWSLWTVIRQHVLNGDLRVFSPYNPFNKFGEWDGYQLKYPVDPEPGLNFYTDSAYREEMVYFLGYLGPQSDIPLTDQYGDPLVRTTPDGFQEYVYPPRDTIWYTSKDIVQYRIKEDWFFDKERSVLDVRILAMAPVVYDMEEDANGNKSISGMKELFWLYFPHCRFVFNNYFVYNDKNDAQWMSFDDLFWKRRFNSVIYKESNTYDRKIESYRAGVDALYESEQIKNEIRNIEHDVWSF
ncbi:MAG: gliding motility protein GldN [Crocinitomicaceae bacterium]|nr:gliding motility protein GldN [Crocinitomicaceae bacterium]